MLLQFESTLKTTRKLQSDTNQVRPAQDDKKKCFFGLEFILDVSLLAFLSGIFLLTLFDNTLKYTYICQQANINRQQAKMTFQFACRKLQRSKDLEPAGPVNEQ
jgi:hypothetical protein